MRKINTKKTEFAKTKTKIKQEGVIVAENQENQDWLKWLAAVMQNRPKGNTYLDSERGFDVGRLCINLNREMFSWRRSDVDTFWLDVQFYTKYKLTDEQISFIEKMQA